MSVRHKRMLGILLGAVMVSLWWGCSQPDDILSEIGNSTFYLEPERLPSLPSDMAYELWLTDGAADSVSLGKFKWNNVTRRFTDLNGNARPDSNRFNLTTDALNYKFILLSVEVHPDADPVHPGPIMLQDTMNDPDLNPIALRFPYSDSLWNAIAFFNMETPTDSSTEDNDGYGVWFSSYHLREDSIRDTFSLDSFRIDTVLSNQPPDPTQNGEDTFFVSDITNIYVDTITRIFGFDTLQQIVARYTRVTDHDGDINSVDATPGQRISKTNLTLWFTYDPIVYQYQFGEYFQLSGGYGFLDYTPQGWLYRAWVVSTVAADAGCGVGSFTPPAWSDTDPINRYIPGHSSGTLLPIGRFAIDTLKDLDDPYSIGPQRPNLPGEDFLQNLPCGTLPSGGLISDVMNPAGTFGSVVVTLEPVNFTRQGQTNFPLIMLSRELPRFRAEITTDSILPPPDDSIRVGVEEFLMRPFAGAVHGDAVGFPRINVTLIRK